jgi:hypothetical protein
MAIDYSDETWEEEQSRLKNETFFGSYSDGIRNILLSKNIEKPQNLYDILYTPARATQLAKNVETIFPTLDETSKVIRDNQLKNLVVEQINLDQSGEKTRTSQLAKNSLIQSTINLSNISVGIRNNLLTQNVETPNPIDVIAQSERTAELSTNVETLNPIDTIAQSERTAELATNVETLNPIDTIAQSERTAELATNVETLNPIDTIAQSERTTELATNVETPNPIDNIATSERTTELATNVETPNPIDNIATSERTTELATNVETPNLIDTIATSERTTELATNVETPNPIDTIAQSERTTELATNVETPNPIDTIAQSERTTELATNVDTPNPIDTIAQSERTIELATNVDTPNPIDTIAQSERTIELATNVETPNPIDVIAQSERTIELATNVDTPNPIDVIATSERTIELATNVETPNPIDVIATSERTIELATNVDTPNPIDIIATSERTIELATNVDTPNPIDIIATSERTIELATNVDTPNPIDTIAQTERTTELATNVENPNPIDAIAQFERSQELATNVETPNPIDIIAQIERTIELSTNVETPNPIDIIAQIERTIELSTNVETPNPIDIIAQSERTIELSSNVETQNNIEIIAQSERTQELSSNVDARISLDSNSDVYRNNMLAKNAGFIDDYSLGSGELGIGNQGNLLGTTLFIGGESVFVGLSNLAIMSFPIRQLMLLENKIFDNSKSLFAQYGISATQNGVLERAGVQYNIPGTYNIPQESMNSYARYYNLGKNLYNSIPTDNSGIGAAGLLGNNNHGFQQLFDPSVGNTPIDSSAALTYTRIGTNLLPASVVKKNSGAYLGINREDTGDATSPITDLLRPDPGTIGSPQSMMSNTAPSDIIQDTFNKDIRGVKNIIKTIRDSSVLMNINYDSQNSTFFIIGTNEDGSNKFARQRFTIANPYQPNTNSGALMLQITNYAILHGGGAGGGADKATMNFPPYIKGSLQHSSSAKFNSIEFLGRPEPIYTYSNTTREGSLSFYILTDYAQTVDLGWDFTKNEKVSMDFTNTHFTNNPKDTTKIQEEIDIVIDDKQTQINKLQTQLTQSVIGGGSGTALLRSEINILQDQISELQIQKNYLFQQGKSNKPYNEYDAYYGNIYQSLIKNGLTTDKYGDATIQIEDTVTRLNRMKQNLLFQPAFFSGDKVDFINRVEFLEKLTRPAKNSNSSGFAFTYPPIAKLSVGDYINHTIIVNNVSFSYEDSLWAADGLNTGMQPNLVLVNLAFNIVGTFGGKDAQFQSVPLADDVGGFYSPRTA